MINVIDSTILALRDHSPLTYLLGNKHIYHVKLPPEYEGENRPISYVIVTEISNTESISADDEEYADDIELQVDIWTSGSTIPVQKAIQTKMRQLGFAHQAMPDQWDSKLEKNHKIIRFFITANT